ncbi:MAG: DsbA family protein [Minisyncoccia bacterium]
MENKSILLVVASILLSGMMIASAVLYNGVQSRANNTASNTAPQQDQNDPVDARNISVDLSEDTPYLGSKSKSQIAIIEFSDFECPFCKKFHDESRKEIIEQYVNTDKAILAWKDYPLDFHDPLATKQAVAAQCVYEQKGNQAYFEYVDLIFANTKSGGEGMQESKLNELAREIQDLDTSKFDTCLKEEETLDKVKADMDFANQNGVNGTPGFIIGKLENGKLTQGIRIAGALPIDTFKTYIDEFLQ